MQERAKRPSKLVQSIARWAITLGVAGTVIGGTAMYGVLLREEQVSSKYNLLLLSAALLAVSFVLAPFVRRTFGLMPMQRAAPPGQRTLLDEMRERPHAPEGDVDLTLRAESVPAEPEPAESATDGQPSQPRAVAVRLVTIAYVMFGAMLLTVLWAMQNE